MANPAVHAVIFAPLVISLARFSPICDWTDRHVVNVGGTLNIWPGPRREKFDAGQRDVDRIYGLTEGSGFARTSGLFRGRRRLDLRSNVALVGLRS